jgi:hypothetical protein
MSAAAVSAAGTAEAAPWSGDVELAYNHGDIENNNGNDFEDGDVRELALGGRIGGALGPVYVQGDGYYEHGLEDYDTTPFVAGPHARYSIGLHGGYRTDNFYIGGFYNYQWAERINLSGEIEFDTLGVEGQLHFETIGLSGQAGSAEVRDNMIGTWHDIAFYRAGLSYYFTPNLRLSGEVLHAEGEVEGADEAPLTHWSLELRKRFSAAPAALFVRYEHGDFRNETETPNDVLEDSVFSIGVSYAFGGAASQREYDRAGASLSSPDNLLRYMGYSGDFD